MALFSLSSTAPLELFRDRLPRRPYCTDELDRGLVVRDARYALMRRYIQHNQPAIKSWLVYDVDLPEAAIAWDSAGLPAPNLVVQNPQNGHAHLAYSLASPVCVSAAARPRPLRFASAIDSAYRAMLRADSGYSGLIMKNPFASSWRTFVFHTDPYDLAELAEYVELEGRSQTVAANDHDYGLGRNCTLFEQLRHWAYVAVRGYWGSDGFERWQAAVEDQATACNVFPVPLPLSEVRSTARSVARWTWKHCTPASFNQLVECTHSKELQRARGIRSGETRRRQAEAKADRVKELAQHMSVRQIAAETGIPRSTVSRLLKL